MYEHILIPTDGTKLSARAVKAGLGLAQKLGARVTALHVIAPYMAPYYEGMMIYVPPSATDPESYKRVTEAEAKRLLDEIVVEAQTVGVPCDSAFVTEPQPWHAVINCARAKKCDLIVMASHGRRGLSGLLLGSETNKVLTHSQVPVLVCR
jgi:nucleotide-binding universal stress UspA family protein